MLGTKALFLCSKDVWVGGRRRNHRRVTGRKMYPSFMWAEYYKGRVKFRKYNNLIHVCFLCCQQTCNLASKKLPDKEKKKFPLAQSMSRLSSLVLSCTHKYNTEPCQNLVQNQKNEGKKMWVNLLIHSRLKCLGTSSALTPWNVLLAIEVRNGASNQWSQQNWSSVICTATS